LTLGIVRSATDVGLFRGAQAPQTGFAALSSPLRMILLTEQTRDWEHGRPEVVLAGIRRYTIGAAAIAAVALGPALWAMPWAVRVWQSSSPRSSSPPRGRRSSSGCGGRASLLRPDNADGRSWGPLRGKELVFDLCF